MLIELNIISFLVVATGTHVEAHGKLIAKQRNCTTKFIGLLTMFHNQTKLMIFHRNTNSIEDFFLTGWWNGKHFQMQ